MQLQIQNKQSLKILLFFSLVYKRNDIIRNLYYLKNFLFYVNKKDMVKSYFYNIFYSLPIIKGKVTTEINKFNSDMKKQLVNAHQPYVNIIKPGICKDGYTSEQIFETLTELKNNGNNKNINYVSGAIYNQNNSEIELIQKILPIFFKSNPLHPELYPQISFLEKTIIKSIAKLFHGDSETVGCITSGGTESILCACYAYKKYGLKKGIKNPENIAPPKTPRTPDKGASYN